VEFGLDVSFISAAAARAGGDCREGGECRAGGDCREGERRAGGVPRGELERVRTVLRLCNVFARFIALRLRDAAAEVVAAVDAAPRAAWSLASAGAMAWSTSDEYTCGGSAGSRM